jgi:hypothetical protein
MQFSIRKTLTTLALTLFLGALPSRWCVGYRSKRHGNMQGELKKNGKNFSEAKILKVGDLVEYDNRLSNYDSLNLFTGMVLDIYHAPNGWVYYDILIKGHKTRIWSGYVSEVKDG